MFCNESAKQGTQTSQQKYRTKKQECHPVIEFWPYEPLFFHVFPRQWLPCLLSFVKQTMKLVARMIPNLQAYRTPGWVNRRSHIWGHNAFASFKVEVKDLILLENKKVMIHGTLAVYPKLFHGFQTWLPPCPLSSPVVHGFQGAGNGTCKTSPENNHWTTANIS